MTAQPDPAEVAEMEARRAQAQAELSEAEAERSRIQQKIERLRAANTKIESEESNLNDIMYGQIGFFNGLLNGFTGTSPNWKGRKFDEMTALVDSDICSAFSQYRSDVDQIHDEIRNEITRLENKLYEQNGLIGRLQSLLNSIGNFFSTLFT